VPSTDTFSSSFLPSVKLPLLEKAELHLLLVVAKSVVHAIHYADAGRYRQQKRGKATCIIACSL